MNSKGSRSRPRTARSAKSMRPPPTSAPPTSSSTRARGSSGKKVVLPAGVIDRIDLEVDRVTVRLTKDQIKGSPEYDADTYRTPDYRTRLGSYYSDARM